MVSANRRRVVKKPKISTFCCSSCTEQFLTDLGGIRAKALALGVTTKTPR